jgi:RecB family exonuclease
MPAPQSDAVSSRRNRWHQSTLESLIDGCAFQYFLIYEEGLDPGPKPFAAVGTAYHSVIEHRERCRMESKTLPTLQESLELGRTLLAETIPVTELEPHQRIAAAITNFYRHMASYLDQFEPVFLEPEFTLPLVDGAKPIGGYIDGIYRDPATSQVFVIDHKTVKDFSRWRTVDSHRHQAAMYGVATVLDDRFPMTELPEMRYLLVRTSIGVRQNFEASRVMTLQPDIEDVRVLGERVRLAEAMVESRRFPRNLDWGLCHKSWCGFWEACVRTGELPVQYSIEEAPVSLRLPSGTSIEGESNV